jgi:hypothetical protein
MGIGWSSRRWCLVVSLGAAVALAAYGELPQPPEPTAGGDHCGTIDVLGLRAWPKAGTGMDAVSCILVALHACRPGVSLVVHTFGTDTSDTTTDTVESAPCRLAVSDTFFSPAVNGGSMTTYDCGSASLTAGGLQITGCTLTDGETQTVPTLGPAPTYRTATPSPTPTPDGSGVTTKVPVPSPS